MILSDDLCRAASGCRAATSLVLAVWLLPLQVSACDTGTLCGGNIDSFFLPLIASSMTEGPRTGIASAGEPEPAAGRLPARPVIIKPPPRKASRPAETMPGWRVDLVQQLVPGPLADGGHGRLYVDSRPGRMPAKTGEAGGTGDRPPAPAALYPDRHGGETWRMEHELLIPAHAGWPLGTIRQNLAMRLVCGACGPDAAPHVFSGSAWLELSEDGLAEGWIEDMELASADGMTATGTLSFLDEVPERHLIRDRQAQMSLSVGDGNGGGKKVDFTGDLASWIEASGRIGGLFSGVPLDGTSGIGGVAAQFSGAPCPVRCGVEN